MDIVIHVGTHDLSEATIAIAMMVAYAPDGTALKHQIRTSVEDDKQKAINAVVHPLLDLMKRRMLVVIEATEEIGVTTLGNKYAVWREHLRLEVVPKDDPIQQAIQTKIHDLIKTVMMGCSSK